jgi:hypothetical protein
MNLESRGWGKEASAFFLIPFRCGMRLSVERQIPTI